jgi:hypothetical protein
MAASSTTLPQALTNSPSTIIRQASPGSGRNRRRPTNAKAAAAAPPSDCNQALSAPAGGTNHSAVMIRS